MKLSPSGTFKIFWTPILPANGTVTSSEWGEMKSENFHWQPLASRQCKTHHAVLNNQGLDPGLLAKASFCVNPKGPEASFTDG